MKIAQIISASALAGAILLSSTACSGNGDDKTAEPHSSSQIVTVETNASTGMTSKDKKAVADAVNSYYSYVSDPTHLAEIQKAAEPFKDHAKKVTDEELKALVAALPAGFKYFDTSSSNLIKTAYTQLFMAASITSKGSMEINVPVEAISFDGDTATVNAVKMETKLNGKKIETPANPSTLALKLKKNDSGSWVMVAASVPGLSESNGFAAAVSGIALTK